MRRRAIGLLTVLMACATTPKSTPPVSDADYNVAINIDFSKLTARRDSFVVFVGGSPLGHSIYTLERRADGLTFNERLSILGGLIVQASIMQTDTALSPRKLKQSLSTLDQRIETSIDFADGRAKGSAGSVTAAGPTSTPINAAITDGMLLSAAVPAVVPLLRWADGVTFTVNIFAHGLGVTQPITFAVVGSASVTVPAGTFDCWKVEQKGGAFSQMWYISKNGSPKAVKIARIGQAFEFHLAK